MAETGVALQMYTVRDDSARDFRGTVRRVAEMGYPALEFAGYGGLSPQEVAALCGELGLAVAGTHTGLDQLESDFAAQVRLHHAIGAHFLTIPSLPGRYPRTEAGYRQAGRDLNALGGRLAAEGITLCYHNHAHEFFATEHGWGLDALFAETDPALVRSELDVYWVAKAGVDPAAYMRVLGSRCTLVHIKDMAEDGSFAEVGTGQLDFAAIFAAGANSDTRWYIVEQDTCRRPPLEAVRISLEHLRRWGRVP